MKKLFTTLLFITAGMIAAGSTYALDAKEQHYLDLLTEGSMHSVKDASQDIFHNNEGNQTVLDTLAEVLLQHYANAPKGDIDALSWAAKALGQSRNPRYRDALSSVAKDSTANKKLRKFADQALENLSDSTVPQYKKGSASLKKPGPSQGK